MKKYFFLIGVVCISFSSIAQHGKVVAAYKYLQDYFNVKDTSSLRNAKESIDAASENIDTKTLAKTWVYKGKIYQTLFEHKYQMEYDKRSAVADVNKRVLEAYSLCNMDLLVVSKDSYLKAQELDAKKSYEEDIKPHFPELSRHFENSAVANYNQKAYDKALIGFEQAMNINSAGGTPDTINLGNAKISAEMSQNNEKANVFYQKMLEYNVGKASTYHNYQYFLIHQMKDENKALEVVKKGRSIYPNDVNLINDETNFYLKSTDPAIASKAVDNLKLALEKNPNDPILNLALGNLYDRLANPHNENGKELAKPANYEQQMADAEKYYKIAYSLNKTDQTVLFNLGALYNNRAKSMLEKSSEIKDDTKYKEAVKAANDVLKLAKPYLEEAFRLNEKDCSVILALKRMYVSTQESDKYAAMSEKSKALGCQ